VAAEEGHEGVVAMLIEAGAGVDLANKLGATPIGKASENGHAVVVALLVEAGADLRDLMMKGKGFELKVLKGGALETCVVYMDGTGRTFFCASAMAAADAKAYLVEGILEVAAVDGSDTAFRITSTTEDPLDLEAPSAKLRDSLVGGLGKLFTSEKEKAAERAEHLKGIGFFPPDALHPPAHIDAAVFSNLMRCKGKAAGAKRGVMYWADATHPDGGTFRDAGGQLITDKSLIAELEILKAEAEAEDEGNTAADLHRKGVRADWLLALTFSLDLWDWKTWEVRASRRIFFLLVVLVLACPPTLFRAAA
jgi:hypothetical protein